ncbi:MAG TPA: hypothetical protein VLM89_06135 [Phycisphaerae bacterium]|nr:hypothetical protein [Phycisphaerae bacterium]
MSLADLIDTVATAPGDRCPPITVTIGAVQYVPSPVLPESPILPRAAERQREHSRTKGTNCCSMKRFAGPADPGTVGPENPAMREKEGVCVNT